MAKNIINLSESRILPILRVIGDSGPYQYDDIKKYVRIEYYVN